MEDNSKVAVVVAVISGLVALVSAIMSYSAQQKLNDVRVIETSNKFELELFQLVLDASPSKRRSFVKLGNAMYLNDDDPSNDQWWSSVAKTVVSLEGN